MREMERLGRKGDPGYQGDLGEGMEALDQGQPDRAMEAMERALNKLRAMENKLMSVEDQLKATQTMKQVLEREVAGLKERAEKAARAAAPRRRPPRPLR